MPDTIYFNFPQMKKRCLDPMTEFISEGVLGGDAKHGNYIYLDRGSPILGVAHLDSVMGLDHFQAFTIDHHLTVFNGQLDDRLGAYIILDLLPTLGVNCDVLLTEGEETGQSTAALFEPTKDYNWMFSFDRMGMDAVMYQYQTSARAAMLRHYGWVVSQGSFSDICFLDHLKCFGCNLGVGYHDYHGPYARANLDETATSINFFLEMYKENREVRMDFDPKSGFPRYRTRYSGGWVEGEFDDWRNPNATVPMVTTYPKQPESAGEAEEKEDALWDGLEEDEIAARQKLETEGQDVDGQQMCPVCHHQVDSDEYRFRYDMCDWCFQDMTEDMVS